jgi:hypothetical protein
MALAVVVFAALLLLAAPLPRFVAWNASVTFAGAMVSLSKALPKVNC